MGADGIVIAAVTAYDPYRPPTVGMSIQLYTGQALAVAGEPEARQIGGTALGGAGGPGAGETLGVAQPVAEAAAMFPANNQTVLAELRDYARGRTNYESAPSTGPVFSR